MLLDIIYGSRRLTSIQFFIRTPCTISITSTFPVTVYLSPHALALHETDTELTRLENMKKNVLKKQLIRGFRRHFDKINRFAVALCSVCGSDYLIKRFAIDVIPRGSSNTCFHSLARLHPKTP